MPRPHLPRSWTTQRLRLRPFVLFDVGDVLAYATDAEWGRFIPVPRPYTPQDAELFVARQVLADHDTEPRWALEHDGGVVGSVELGLEHDAGVASIHYALARPLWGRGLMTEAVRSTIDQVFAGLPHILRIASNADTRNQRSWRVMEKTGMQREGVFRSCRVFHGERVDLVHYALLREDWTPLPVGPSA